MGEKQNKEKFVEAKTEDREEKNKKTYNWSCLGFFFFIEKKIIWNDN